MPRIAQERGAALAAAAAALGRRLAPLAGDGRRARGAGRALLLDALGPQVRVEHARVGADHRGRARDERPALVEHRDLVAQRHHELHVVLDDEEGLAGRVELADAGRELVDQRRVDAAGGLVEQQHRGVGDQERRQLEQLALAVGEVAGGLGREPRDADELEQLARAAALRRRARDGAGRRAASPRSAASRRACSRARVRRAKIRVSWNVRPMPSAKTRSGRRVGDRPPGEPDLAAVRPLVAGDDVEERRLARPVGADQPADRALRDR